MADKVEIDKQTFQDRLSQLISAWKADKRSSDALFGGAGSIVILMGKIEDPSVATFRKNNAMHVRSASYFRIQPILILRQVWLLGYEFPATLFLFTSETLYIVTTIKKGGSDSITIVITRG